MWNMCRFAFLLVESFVICRPHFLRLGNLDLLKEHLPKKNISQINCSYNEPEFIRLCASTYVNIYHKVAINLTNPLIGEWVQTLCQQNQLVT